MKPEQFLELSDRLIAVEADFEARSPPACNLQATSTQEALRSLGKRVIDLGSGPETRYDSSWIRTWVLANFSFDRDSTEVQLKLVLCAYQYPDGAGHMDDIYAVAASWSRTGLTYKLPKQFVSVTDIVEDPQKAQRVLGLVKLSVDSAESILAPSSEQ